MGKKIFKILLYGREDIENCILWVWERRHRKLYYMGEKIYKILLYVREDIEKYYYMGGKI
jgi:hypothetical protein